MQACFVQGLARVALAVSSIGFFAQAGATPVAVASPKIVIQNVAGGLQVPLAASGPEATVQFTSEGDIQVNCRLTEGNCPNLNLGGGFGEGPAISNFTFNAAEVTSGANNATLSWSSTEAEVCYAAGPEGITNWTSGNRHLPRQGSVVLSLAATGDPIVYDFAIRCYREQGSSEATASITVNPGSGGGLPGSPFCAEYYPTPPSSGAFTGWGMNRTDVAFGTIWPGTIGDTGGRRGIPGDYAPTGANDYMSIPFVMQATDQVFGEFLINWSEGTPLVGVTGGQISITVSPCPGDFRTRTNNPPANDVYLSSACAKFNTQTGNIAVTARPGGIGCPAPVGKTMYINITTTNANGTNPPTATSCTGFPCGVNMRID